MSEQNYTVQVTARHMDLTDAMRDHCHQRLSRIHLEYPHIIDAKFILDSQEHRHRQAAELVLYCANNVTLEAKTETNDLYEAIDLTVAKIERQMREEKARLMDRNGRP
ncbi:MAG: ribosome-associated translation inhibitor RaiA [Verrucomicrobia bacterium]|jgi:putative sigma-54 modulation protein|nr:ribosome-associated translation inhibitor RaiA [Verrucomicrobiota bacterium]